MICLSTHTGRKRFRNLKRLTYLLGPGGLRKSTALVKVGDWLVRPVTRHCPIFQTWLMGAPFGWEAGI
ncbi:hypothetical protein DPMN_057405 [Dreissena polymorpha]|uniref:Uncharacterized protein n=1 Tax=Dreissena polymorpha TaxID=45954 RepID=A0A9D4HE37_DREPO|nr:hypothetical protein DPMN_057405 [Dreissena polymorpha]